MLQNYMFFTIFLLYSILNNTSVAQKCNRTPEGHGATKTPADGRFHIRISESTAKYTPGKTYTSKIFIN